MRTTPDADPADRTLIIRTGAAIYAGTVALATVETAIPGSGNPPFAPGLVALAIAVVLLAFGRRLPMPAVMAGGFAGVLLIAWAILVTDGPSDGPALYVLPALWTAAFFGTRAAVAIVIWIAIVHAVTLGLVPDGDNAVDRWLDVVASMAVVAAVVRVLAARNRRLLDDLTAAARTDPLSGLLNRRGFDDRIAIEQARGRRAPRPIAALVIDIDSFKEINDEQGHEAGDRVIALAGAVLSDEIRSHDIVARTGGDEFSVMLIDVQPSDAVELADRLLQRLADSGSSHRRHRGVPGDLEITASIGVACGTSGRDEQALLEAADHAMYDAKRAGRNRALAAAPLSGAASS